MTRRLWIGVALAAVVVLVALLVWRFTMPAAPQPEPEPALPPVTQAPEPAASAASAPAPEKPALEIPATTTPLAADDIPHELTELIGKKAVATFLQLDDFPRRIAATVDNLGRSHAPPALWPVNPTSDRFLVQESDGSTAINLDNSARYTPFVLLVETVDVGRAADLLLRIYPLLQRSYEQLGYPNKKFNDRLLEVIDLLLATPVPTPPIKVELTEVKGPIPSVRPWVRYQYADPALEALSSGQKILVRSGAVNQRRLKGKLAEFRAELVKRATTR
jgi:hypothetical protein